MLIKNTYHLLLYIWFSRTRKLLISQRRNPFLIPIIIINYNQLHTLKMMIMNLQKRGFQNIVVIDNQSSYPPLLEYYKEIEDTIHIERRNDNLGHKVFFNSPDLIRKYAPGYYFLTDPDLTLNENLPLDFAYKMLKLLDKYYLKITKVGFALEIDDLPADLKNRESILGIEKSYYQEEVEKNVFRAETDTTFALYKPAYPLKNYNAGFYKSLRIAGNFTVRHEGWYVDLKNMSTEQKFYYKTSDAAIHSSK